MQSQSQGSMAIVAAISGGVFLVAMVALMVVGDYAFSPALFLALGAAVAVAVFLLIAFHRPLGMKKPVEAGREKRDDVQLERGQARTAPEPKATAEASDHHRPSPVIETAATEHAPSGAATVAAEPASAADVNVPAAPQTPRGTKPATLDAARDGQPDDLKRLRGIGPKLEEMLHRMGVYHYDQIAGWSDDEVAWVDDNLEGFRGRVSRDEWVGQARLLSEGREDEFMEKYGERKAGEG